MIPEIGLAQKLRFPLDRKKTLKAEFEQVALPQLADLYNAALCLTKDKAEAEDLVQETYLRAFRFFDKFQPGTNCRAWLLSILRHLFINRYQQKRREPDTVTCEKINKAYESIVERGEEAEKDNPERLLFSKIMDQEVKEAIEALPEEYRAAIVLVDIKELSYEQASKVMECRIGTLCSRVFRGHRMLRVALRNYALKRGYIN